MIKSTKTVYGLHMELDLKQYEVNSLRTLLRRCETGQFIVLPDSQLQLVRQLLAALLEKKR